MKKEPIAVTVQILGKDYRVSCPREEQEGLKNSARYLDRKMQEIKKGGKIVGSERVAVMAALNIAHELLQEQTVSSSRDEVLKARIQGLQERITVALDSSHQLQM